MSQNPFLFGGGGTPLPPTQQCHPGTPPTTNGASSTPSQAQQTAPPNMSLSSIDLSRALQGISPEQLAMIAQLMQQGAIPMPPAPPSASQAQSPSAVPTPSATNAPSLPQPSAQPPDRDGDVDMDREEGEVEEGEVEDTPKMRDFLSTPPKGPRNNSRSPRPPLPPAQGDRRTSQPSQRIQTPKSSAPSRKPSALNEVAFQANGRNLPSLSQTNGTAHPPTTQLRQEAVAKNFVLALHTAGYTFDDLSREFAKPGALRRLYDQLGLPVQHPGSAPVAVATHNAVTPPVGGEQRKASVTKRPPPAKSSTPQDRSEYLAKLQAAKGQKTEPGAMAPAKPSAPPNRSEYLAKLQAAKNKKVESGETSPAVAQPAKNLPAATEMTKPITPSPVAAKPPKLKTDLVRQRLDALKAQSALKERSSSDGAPSSPMAQPSNANNNAQAIHSSSKPGLGDGLADAASKAGIEVSKIPVPPAHFSTHPPASATAPSTSTSQFPQASWNLASPSVSKSFGLPGLSMNGNSVPSPSQVQPPAPHASASASSSPHPTQLLQQSQSTLPQSALTLSIPIWSPVPSGMPTQRANAGAAGAPKRSFSLQNDSYANEPFIIVDSDDESDAAMDIDDDVAVSTIKTTAPRPGPISNFPAQLNTQVVAAKSTPGTPGTPSEELKRKEEAIKALKDRMAEIEQGKRRKREAQAKANMAGQGPLVQAEILSARIPALESAGHDASSTAVHAANIVNDSSEPQVTLGSIAVRPTTSDERSDSSASHNEESATLKHRLDELEDQVHGGVSLDDAKFQAPTTAGMQAAETQPTFPDDSADISEDDVDFYDVTPADSDHEEAGRKVGSQATTVTAVTEAESQGNNAFDDAGSAARVDVPLDNAGQAKSPAPVDRLPPATHQDHDDEWADDEDDLDDIYGPSTSAADTVASKPALQREFALPQNEVDDDEGGSESDDDAMDTSEGSASDADDDDSESDDSEHDETDDQDLDANPPPKPEDVSTSGADESAESDDGEIANTSGLPRAQDSEMAVDDDLAPELQPAKEEEPLVASEEAPQAKHRYFPYVSPLSRFRDYRYHPDFTKTVPGGFKSLTYTHKIDPDKRLCPFETAGGICNDNNCAYQHFKTMEVTDNELLKIMGTENIPARTQAEKERWNAGLGTLVQELRKMGQSKDVSMIAQRIAQYRREFTGDPTKVLRLD